MARNGAHASSVSTGRIAALSARYANLDGAALLAPLIRREFTGRIAVVASFGAESALLLALVAEIDPNLPVVFLDTGKHFPETLAYRDRLAGELGLTDLRNVVPDGDAVGRLDPAGNLWQSAPDACCHLRKVRALARALTGFDAWISGRKRYQGTTRQDLPLIERDGRRIKVNPLANWSAERVEAAVVARDLPQHPLVEAGYLSIGCAPCTQPALPGGDARSGRWTGFAKTECGIHWPSAAPGC